MSGNSLQEELASTKRKIENTEADIAAIMEVIKIAKNNHRKEEWKILNTRLDKLEDRLNLLQRKENILLEQEKGGKIDFLLIFCLVILCLFDSGEPIQ